ncbi:MAG TPA: GGDEF domain-containing protein [Terracidiphilus sp.]|nr:GGDEF domain-containing protein [Terracidiphilus sp.]
MISIKHYLEETQTKSGEHDEPDAQYDAEAQPLLSVTIAAYRSSLVEMGNCGQDACPALGGELKQGLGKLEEKLSAKLSYETVKETESGVREHLHGWGRLAAMHFQKQTGEVKEILLMMARTAESVGERDQRCAAQITEVTTRLKSIANLEDLTAIRESIKQSATDLKGSIDRMTAEGKAAIDQLKKEVTTYQARLEEAEEIASRDALTGLRNRLSVEGEIELSLHGRAPVCVAIIDINEFKRVNDEHGHLIGDELLKKFAAKMRSVCRSTDTIGRWGGDEFMLLLHCGIAEARTQIDRLREWVCGSYTVQGSAAPSKLRVKVSIGLAERLPGETMKALVDRADAEMYREKAASRKSKNDYAESIAAA